MELKCAACGATGNTDNPPLEFVCTTCGCVNVTEIKNEGGVQACGCLLPTSFEWSLPVGRFGNPHSSCKYVSASGTPMTKTEWLTSYGVDPEIALNWMRSGAAADLRNDDIDLGGGWRRKKGRQAARIGGSV